jgi:phage terminase large subunit-like protein
VSAAPFEIDLDALRALPPEEQREEIARIAELKRRVERNPMWRYLPHEGEKGWRLEKGLPLRGDESRGQVEFHEIARPHGAFVGGNQSGKTTVGCADALIQTLPLELLPPWLHPYKRCEFDKAYTERTRKLQFADGSWWDFLTHDMDIDSYASATLHRVWFDEEPPGEKGKRQYEESLMRVMALDGEIRWTLTPLLGLNFVYSELTTDDKPRDDEECKVVVGDLDHNPYVSEAGRRRTIKKYEKEPLVLQARKSGRWVHFAGMVYDEWSDARHIVPDRAPPRAENGELAVNVYAAIDPGINKDHKAALVLAFLDDQDRLEVFHAWKAEGATVADVAKHYHGICERFNVKPRWVVIDPSAQNRHHATGRSTQWEYARHGIFTIPGQNSRMAGFNRVKERLRDELLVVQASLRDLHEEIRQYRWKSPRGVAEDAPKPEPIKRNDDLVDALRYLVMQAPRPPKSEEPAERLSGPQQAVRENLERLRRGRKARIGGVVG